MSLNAQQKDARSERLTIIVGEYTISKLRSGEAVEFNDGSTLLPASDLATTDAVRRELNLSQLSSDRPKSAA
jgi:hypothetical protein